ncbi:hypothetical protein [Brevibacillus dissolubilis]|uniref:hypothetical protein n=1 Tax=Brevibacillus dissolubilis TaxID=1844116 RepID=UPI00111778CE|nr:hypothetical protein [Brevibacillus dissolubilis]
MSWKRFKYNPTYVSFKLGCKAVLLPLIIFQFIRTMFLPTTFDVIVLGVFALTYIAIHMEWV